MRSDTANAMDAFLEALGGKGSGNGCSVDELCVKMNASPSLVRNKLRALITAGRARHAGFRLGTSMVGRTVQVPVYQIVKKK